MVVRLDVALFMMISFQHGRQYNGPPSVGRENIVHAVGTDIFNLTLLEDNSTVARPDGVSVGDNCRIQPGITPLFMVYAVMLTT